MKNSFLKLKEAVYKGALEKNIQLTDIYLDRLNYELKLIKDKNLIDYFLLYSYLIDVCNELNLLRSFGRNTALNSLVNYCLDITKLEPIEYNLHFERFLHPSFPEVPDIDTDVPVGSTEFILTTFKNKYPEYFIYYLAFKPKYESDYKTVIYEGDEVKKHPCGVIFTKEKIANNTFIFEGAEYYYVNETLSDHYYNNKIDLVELDYLNKIEQLLKTIGNEYHPYSLPLDDQKVFKFLSQRNLENIFQLNEDIEQGLLSQFNLYTIHDLAYLKVLLQKRLVSYNSESNTYNLDCNHFPPVGHNRVIDFFNEIYFSLVFQETFLQLCLLVADMDYETTERYRRYLSRPKSYSEYLPHFIKEFREKAKSKSILSEIEIEQVLIVAIQSINYTLPKGHVYSYSLISYWSAYYKTYFNKEFNQIFIN